MTTKPIILSSTIEKRRIALANLKGVTHNDDLKAVAAKAKNKI